MKYIFSAFLLYLIPTNFAFAEEVKTTFKNQSELGVVIAGGNTKSQTVNLKTNSEYTWSKNLLRGYGALLYGKADGEINARNWNAGLRYEREVGKRLSLFFGILYEVDKFAGYDSRRSADLGVKYYFIKEQDHYLFNEGGYRYTYEDRVDGSAKDSLTSHIARLYAEWGKNLSETTKIKFWAEYLPDFADSNNYKLNFEPSLQMIVRENFSVKLAYKGNYQNQPATAENLQFDYTYTTSLVADF